VVAGLPPELAEALLAPSGETAFRALDDAGLLARFIPELERGRGFRQPELHYYAVLDHNFATVGSIDEALGETAAGRELRDALHWVDFEEAVGRTIEGWPIRSLLRLAALLHDVAKPETATWAEGRLRFPRHGPRGAELMRERLPTLGLGPAATAFVAAMIRYHLRPGELVRNWPPSDHAVRRFVRDLDGHVLPLLMVNLADGWATRGPGYTRENFRRHVGFANYVLARAWAVSDEGERPLVNGDDLIAELDLGGGRLLGAVLTSVREAQLRGEISDRAGALSLARETLDRLRGEAASEL
jgi:hypothetical protein